jgi:hypothetical protein
VKRKCLPFSLILVALSLIGCDGPFEPVLGEQTVVERVPRDRPEWIHQYVSSEKKWVIHVGMKTHATSIEHGMNDARHNVTQKFIEFIGGTGMVDYVAASVGAGLIDEALIGNYIEDSFRFLAGPIDTRMRVSETYYERVKEWRRDGWFYFYNYYVLMVIEKSQIIEAAQEAYGQMATEAQSRNDLKAEEFANQLYEQINQLPN